MASSEEKHKSSYWEDEFTAAKKRLEKFHKNGDKVVSEFLGGDAKESGAKFKLNLFHSNIVTVSSLLYGNLPKIDVSRRFADPNDDVSRVAAETMERVLNIHVEEDSESYSSVFEGVLQDRLLAGLGVARVRYDFETNELGEVQDESAPIDYFHWRDVLWGWGRSFSDLPWIAFRSFLSKEEVEQRFSKKIAKNITMQKQGVNSDGSTGDIDESSPWDKAEIWEIWDKDTKEVIWFSIGYGKLLETKKDPLKLSNFYPCPPFLMANATTSLYVPKADYKLAEDLYVEIDNLQTRISIITEAVKVVGVYDKGSEGVQRIFNEGVDNTLVPVDNWAMFSEKGGIKGQIDWMPLGEIVATLDKLITLRDQSISMLQQVTGMSDIMQGGLKNQYEGNAQSAMKAKFGSVRIQQIQESFARFASGLMQIKAEIISMHFEPETIARQSNMQSSFDAEVLPQAIQLIKDPKVAKLRVAIRPESVAMTDFAQLKDERSSFINAISTFLQSASPLMEAEPATKPFLMQLLQWVLAGYKGSSEIEGVLDKAISAAEKQAKEDEKNPKPDPEKQKMDMMMQLEQTKMQGEMQKIQAKNQADMQLRQQDQQSDIQTAMAIHQAKMAEISASMQAKIAETNAKLEASLLVEQAQAASTITQNTAMAQNEVSKDRNQASLDMAKEQHKTELKIQELSVQSATKIDELVINGAVSKEVKDGQGE